MLQSNVPRKPLDQSICPQKHVWECLFELLFVNTVLNTHQQLK